MSKPFTPCTREREGSLKPTKERKSNMSKTQTQELTEYKKVLAKVILFRDMTESEPWQTYYSSLRDQSQRAHVEWVTCDPPKEMVRLQSIVRVIEDMVPAPFRQVCESLQRFQPTDDEFPGMNGLDTIPATARFNEETGKIEISPGEMISPEVAELAMPVPDDEGETGEPAAKPPKKNKK